MKNTVALLTKCLLAALLALGLAGCLPIPIISVDPGTPEVGEVVTFDGTGTVVSNVPADTVIASYTWDFGDGSSGKGETVEHTYKFAGKYTVSLSVVDSAGRKASVEELITVEAASSVDETTSTTETTTSTTATE